MRRTITSLLIAAMAFSLCACGAGDKPAAYYEVKQTDGLNFSYTVYGTDGKVLDEGESQKEPVFTSAGEDILRMTVQTGTGLSTNYAVFYDLKNGDISDTYHYVLAAENGYVVCIEYKGGEHFAVVDGLFLNAPYHTELKLESAAAPAEFTPEASFDASGNVTVTYPTDDGKETTCSIELAR